jgi:hypothetical protein|tara:strand:+ start:126 stop:374 length:249 start_codon:yes stop_codon:yes gene_type:complete
MNKLNKIKTNMNIKQHKAKLNKMYNQAIVDEVLNTMWSKLGNELDNVMMESGDYSETNDIMFEDQDQYMSIIINTMKSQCDD